MTKHFTLNLMKRLSVGVLLMMAALMTPSLSWGVYCIPGNTLSTGYYINSFSTTGGLVNITNNNSGFSPGGYGNFTATQTVSQVPGGSVSFAGSFPSTYGVRIWVDWNQDTDFDDPGEQVFITSTYVGSIAGTITVPAAALIGTTRMRVGCHWLDATGPTACLTGNQYTEFEDYNFTVVALVSCATATFPASSTVTANPVSVCGSGNVNLGFVPVTAMPAASGVTYQWQSAPAATGPWTNIGTASASSAYTAAVSSPTTTNIYFRVLVLCNATTTVMTSAASVAVNIANPGTATGVPGSRCGPGSVALSATGPTGTTLRWYANLTGGAPLFTGANFNTPYITSTTNYYVSAGTAPSAATASIGAGALTAASPVTPFYGAWGGYKHEYLILASELIAAGINPGSALNSIGIQLLSGGTTYNGLSINLTNTSITAVNATAWQPSGATNYGPVNYAAVLGVNTFTFGAPFTWTGGNLLIQTCWSNGTTSNPYTYAAYDNTSFAATHYGYGDLLTPAVVCVAPTNIGTTINARPKFIINYDGSCQGTRVPVAATVNASPVVTKTAPLVVCNNSAATIALTPPTPAYPNYTWTPATNLYTDVAGTTPYVAGSSATTVYMKTTNVGEQTYFLMAGNPALTTGCTFADTIKIHSQPGNVTIKGQPDTICVSGSTKLTLDTAAGYYPGSIQWQTSTNGTTYTDIAGATNPIYNTPVLAFGQNTYYRAVIKAGTATCMMPVKYVVIANPTILSAPDSFHCGPGVVTLNVITGGNGSAVWYQNASGGLPIASGTPFLTPYLGNTTTYYVSSGGGGSAGLQTVGAGALISATQSVTPFSSGWGGSKHQYLIRAAELTAAGIPSGASINSLALDVVAGGILYPGFAISMKNTTTTALPASYEAGAVQVRVGTNHTTIVGINSFSFTTPFVWDGTSNLLIQTCWSNATANATGSTVKMDNTAYVSSRRGQTDNQTPANMCGVVTPSTSLNYSQRPKFILGYDNRCESARKPVVAYIRPVPVVDLGDDINKCIDDGIAEVLDAGVQPDGPQFLWDNGSTSQVRAVTESGSYNVKVTNQYSCSDADTVNVILRNNPLVNLGNDTTVCNGVVLNLNPGNTGIEYFWNTGQTSQNINVSSPGTYSVFVTNSQGCTKADTITVNMEGELPKIQGIQATNNGQYTFHFTAVNAENVIGYDWDFGDNSAHSYQMSPTHTYPDAGNYIVILHLSSSCGFFSDSSSAHILGINQLNVDKNEMTVYPNPTRETATILNRGALKMENIEIYNVLGQVVYKAKADSKDKHNLDLSGFSSGIYTIQIFTEKGTVARKLEVIR